jgi:hypothetical protein
VYGESLSGTAIWGKAQIGAGVQGISDQYDGVNGQTNSPQHAGVSGTNFSNYAGAVPPLQPSAFGVYAASNNCGLWATGNPAGYFVGNVIVTGDISLPGADCAEQFEAVDGQSIEPGCVLVVDEEGRLNLSRNSYDRRVAGIVSGAGQHKAAIVLDSVGHRLNTVAVALVGKTYCKVDASYAPIEVGDLLTTSETPGHAMKANDHHQAFGAVVGKALRSARQGKSLIPVLVALQ